MGPLGRPCDAAQRRALVFAGEGGRGSFARWFCPANPTRAVQAQTRKNETRVLQKHRAITVWRLGAPWRPPACVYSSAHSRGDWLYSVSMASASPAYRAFSYRSLLIMGIHTQGAQKMPWQDLRTARGGGNGFDLRFGACAVAVSLGVGRLWPRNPLTGSACSVAFLRVLRLGSLRALGWLSGVQNTQNFFSAIAKVRIGLVFRREVQSCRFLCLRLILARGCYVRASLLCEGRASPSSGPY